MVTVRPATINGSVDQSDYQKTDIGLIPSDWDVEELGNIGAAFIGLTYSPRDVHSDGTLVLRSSNVQNGRLRFDDNVYVKVDVPDRATVRANDILVCVRNGSRDLIGKSAVIDDLSAGMAFGAFMGLYRSEHNSFLAHVFKSDIIMRQVHEHLGATINQITNKSLNGFKSPLPKNPDERNAIGKALDDADALVESLERLIAKKREIKNGIMQRILSESDAWDETSLIELCENKKELFDDGDWIESEHITDDGVRLIQTGNIGVGKYVEKDARKYIFPTSFTKLRCKELRTGDLLICRLADPAGRACILPDIGEARVVTSVDVTICRPPERAANRIFLANLLCTKQWFQSVSDRSGGTTHKRIARGALGKIKFKLPSIELQNHYARLLQDVDDDIAALSSKLTKAHDLKRGMMQELLTGRLRLV